MLTGAAIARRRLAYQLFEIRREMRLVVVAELLRQCGQVDGGAVGQLVGGVEQAVAADHPLGANAHGVAKQQLQRPYADAQQRRQLRYLRYFGMLAYLFHDHFNAFDAGQVRRRLCRQSAPYHGAGRLHHAGVVRRIEHAAFSLFIVAVE